jgi:hypothetical protein
VREDGQLFGGKERVYKRGMRMNENKYISYML